MTRRGEVPSRRNRRSWTAYERSRDGVGFDLDGYSDLTIGGAWASSITDWEDWTILEGLGSVESDQKE